MGKKSIKENKNIYQLSREAAGLTREKASEIMEYISSDRIEKIESEKTYPHPDEILAMAKAYKAPELQNYYCTRECAIGEKYVPVIEKKDLPMIVLEILAGLNALNAEKDRLVEMAVDGEITADEYQDFLKIRDRLKDFRVAINEMRLWIEQEAAEGGLDVKGISNLE